MTPYGIVYRENPHAFGESVKVWQKKFGVLTKNSIIKMFLIMLIEIVACSFLMLLIKADPFFIVTTPVFGAVMAVIAYFSIVKNSIVRQTVRANFRPDDVRKQVVLFEDRLEYTTSFGKGSYYYGEIPGAYEKNGVLTIMVDTNALPISIHKHSVEKGEYDKLTCILKASLGGKYEYEGGNF